ncbi:hypothetical protein DB88DRAFT_479390 [Papiliotrema laurentii]|uniref:C2H2-type domain-containing protein n=1 Tax=Papiliotrema laurentii TaxID=5418 RepID=A0AAD9FX20_PAPLA|nr:hypothetical protein DB88DRAFT_479390 [Papiliotrema laurentii]
MSEAKPAAAQPSRKQWDKSEWEAKAKAKDAEYAEKAKAAEDAMAHGKRPKFKNPMDDLPKPTKDLQRRTEDLGLEKGLNKTTLVQISTSGKGPRGPGFYCEMCNRTLKDSLSYLDHLNSRPHLAMLGQTTYVTRSTVSQVRARIAQLRQETANKVTAANFDFQRRLKEVRDAEEAERKRRREEKKRKREERREEEALGRIGVVKRVRVEGSPVAGEAQEAGEVDVEKVQKEHDDMAAMMGFGGFGGKRR